MKKRLWLIVSCIIGFAMVGHADQMLTVDADSKEGLELLRLTGGSSAKDVRSTPYCECGGGVTYLNFCAVFELPLRKIIVRKNCAKI